MAVNSRERMTMIKNMVNSETLGFLLLFVLLFVLDFRVLAHMMFLVLKYKKSVALLKMKYNDFRKINKQ